MIVDTEKVLREADGPLRVTPGGKVTPRGESRNRANVPARGPKITSASRTRRGTRSSFEENQTDSLPKTPLQNDSTRDDAEA